MKFLLRMFSKARGSSRAFTSNSYESNDLNRAYMYLVFRAFLDIRSLAWQEKDNQKEIADLTDAFHNLPYFASNEYKEFNEQIFWRYVDTYNNKYPGSTNYRKVFDDYLISMKDGN